LEQMQAQHFPRGKTSLGLPPQPSPPTLRQAILDALAQQAPSRCPHCRYQLEIAKGALDPGDIDDQLAKMTLLGHMRKRSKSSFECKFAIHYRGDPVLLDEPIHVFEIFA
jgi:hypothetical protein